MFWHPLLVDIHAPFKIQQLFERFPIATNAHDPKMDFGNLE